MLVSNVRFFKAPPIPGLRRVYNRVVGANVVGKTGLSRLHGKTLQNLCKTLRNSSPPAKPAGDEHIKGLQSVCAQAVICPSRMHAREQQMLACRACRSAHDLRSLH